MLQSRICLQLSDCKWKGETWSPNSNDFLLGHDVRVNTIDQRSQELQTCKLLLYLSALLAITAAIVIPLFSCVAFVFRTLAWLFMVVRAKIIDPLPTISAW